jgi:L-ascorbate metabolism protein UlaG (beta-lactamase superfamily)
VNKSSGNFQILSGNKINIHTNTPSLKATAYKVSHGSNAIQNYGLYIELGGKSFFHPGDISTTIKTLKENNIDKLKIDYLMMSFWILLDQTSIELTKEVFNFKHIIPMHMPIVEKDWMKASGGLKIITERAHRVFPKRTIKLLQQNRCTVIN